jgi:hypothetical protein
MHQPTLQAAANVLQQRIDEINKELHNYLNHHDRYSQIIWGNQMAILRELKMQILALKNTDEPVSKNLMENLPF